MVAWLLMALLACDRTEPDVVAAPEPGELRAGIARARIPAPVGIGTAGFGPFGAPSSHSPFSEIYPATQRIFGHPEVKVVALSRGEGFEAIFVRLDAVGVFAQLRSALVDELKTRLGRDVDDALIIGATHTHSGPGRVLNTGTASSSFFDLVVDTFFPEFYERFIDTLADAVEAALADLQPARLGTAMADCPAGHNDRRCEDGEDYQNGAAPLLVVERDGAPYALVTAYAVHGTVLGIDELYLSQDVSGAIETAIEDRFDHPVMAVMFNSWGADMSPADPEVTTRAAAVREGSYDRMWRVGSVVADAVDQAMATITWDEQPTIDLQTRRIPIDRERIGYPDDVFKYPFGAVYCGTDSGSCEAPAHVEGLDKQCIPMGEAYPAPQQVDVTTGTVGPYALITFPGEPGTHLAEQIMADVSAEHDGPAFFLGYTQDYLGYSLLEEDWWYGGYEASGALWGPRQGEYLASHIADLWLGHAGAGTPPETVPRLDPFPYTVGERYVVATAEQPNTLMIDVPSQLAATEVLTLTVRGHDPWLGTPRAWVRGPDGEALTRPNGLPLDSDDQNWDVSLVVVPEWSVDSPTREFQWTFRLSPRSPLPGGLDIVGKQVHVVVDLPQPYGEVVRVESAAVSLVEPAF